MTDFFNFSGRARRSEFWLVNVLVGMAILVGSFAGFTIWGSSQFYLNVLSVVGTALTTPIAVRRLHDRDRPAWLVVPFWLLLPAVSLLPAPAGDMIFFIRVILAASVMLIALWGFIELGFLPGTNGENQHGPDRRAPIPA